MLKIETKRSVISGPRIFAFAATILLIGGGYVLTLVGAPAVAPLITMKPISVNALPAPAKSDNRIIIPKIGVNIVYGEGKTSLDKGAEWRHPERGNPENGGNFIIAAHRFSIQPTPLATIEKSPFYSIDKLAVGDKIVIDYNGTRYGYEIDTVTNVKPDQTEIEAPSETPKLTLYSCELDGSSAGRVVLTAKPLGKVAVQAN
jgi:sortase A